MLTKHKMSDDEFDDLPTVVNLATAARALGMGRRKAYELVGRGEFPVRIRTANNRYTVAKHDLAVYLRGHNAVTHAVTSDDAHRNGGEIR